MLSALSQQLKWFSFLLLILFLQLPSPANCEGCQFRCTYHRPTRYGAYTVKCDDLVDVVDECKEDCKNCSAICNQNTNTFNCPAIDLARCEKHCDDNRPLGSTSAYTLDCHKRNLTKPEVDKCKSLCLICKFAICIDDHTFHCPPKKGPSSAVSQACKDHCDTKRKDEFAYTFDCATTDAFWPCTKNCPNCPRQICHPYDPGLFKCPKGSTVCELRCNRNRPMGSNSAYTHSCNDTRDVCENDCRLCPKICKIRDPLKFNCPAKGVPVPTGATTTTKTTTTTRPTTTKPPTYKGPCEKRCNSKRPKGSKAAYKLICKTAYSNKQDIDKCNKECKLCPSYVCFLPGEYNCPANKELEPESSHTKEKEEDKQLSTLAIVGIAIVLLIILFVVGGIVYYAYFIFGRKKAKTQVVPEKEVEGLFEFSSHDEPELEISPPETIVRSSSSISKSDSFNRFSFGSSASSGVFKSPTPKKSTPKVPARKSTALSIKKPTPKSKAKKLKK